MLASGQGYAYSNAGYALAAPVLARASGHESWEALVAKAFHKLKLRYDAGLSQPPLMPGSRGPLARHYLPTARLRRSVLPTLTKAATTMAPAGDLAMPLP
ncbi:MAG: hypothetical protein WKG07_26760 [Hymenobacter sp.]